MLQAHRVTVVGGRQQLWTPRDLPTRPVIWLDASDAGTITIATGVSSWANKGTGGAAAQATGGSQPAYVTSSLIVGKPAVRFNGTAHNLAGTSAVAGTSVSAFVLATCNHAGSVGNSSLVDIHDGVLAAVSSSTGLSPFRRNGTGALLRSVYASNALADKTTVTDTPFIYQIVKNATDIRTYLNEDSGATGVFTGTLASTSFRVGVNALASDAAGTGFWKGDVYELVVVVGALSTDQRQKLAGAIAWKWGVASAILPVDHPYRSAPPLL
jgi:hypothetical protein